MLMRGWVVHPHGHMHRAHVEGPPKGGGPMELFGRFKQGKGLKHGFQGRFVSFHMRYKASIGPIIPKITLVACLIYPKATAKIWGASGKVQI